MPLPTEPELPFPPDEMRRLVGHTDVAKFDNPTGGLAFPEVPVEAYDSVLDFGCGCGRSARQLMQQRLRPRAYLGIDAHRGMVQWCQRHLAPHAPGFRFEHHDVLNRAFNPQGARATLELPAASRSMSLVHAWSVFTHLVEEETKRYLAETARVLVSGGRLLATFFLLNDFSLRNLPTRLGGYTFPFERASMRLLDPDNPAAGVALPEEVIVALLRDARFEISKIDYGEWSEAGVWSPDSFQ